MPMQAVPMISQEPQRPVSRDSDVACLYLYTNKYLMNVIEKMHTSHAIKTLCEITFHKMKVRIEEFTKVAIMLIGAFA
jgi:hypothetical protein